MSSVERIFDEICKNLSMEEICLLQSYLNTERRKRADEKKAKLWDEIVNAISTYQKEIGCFIVRDTSNNSYITLYEASFSGSPEIGIINLDLDEMNMNE